MQLKPTIATKTQEATAKKTTVDANNDERQRMVAEAAYFLAQHRGFQGGDVRDDWHRAEAEIDALIGERKAH